MLQHDLIYGGAEDSITAVVLAGVVPSQRMIRRHQTFEVCCTFVQLIQKKCVLSLDYQRGARGGVTCVILKLCLTACTGVHGPAAPLQMEGTCPRPF